MGVKFLVPRRRAEETLDASVCGWRSEKKILCMQRNAKEKVMRVRISRSVGNNLANSQEDVLKIKKGLSRLGIFYFSNEPSPHGYITRQLHDSIVKFQKNSDLKVDGVILPEGETLREINNRIQKIQNEENPKAHPAPKVEKGEILPPPKPKNIPGTNIPDLGTAEGEIFGPRWGYNGNHREDPRFKMDKGILKRPKDIDPAMEIKYFRIDDSKLHEKWDIR